MDWISRMGFWIGIGLEWRGVLGKVNMRLGQGFGLKKWWRILD
jgi:hypothetical protein